MKQVNIYIAVLFVTLATLSSTANADRDAGETIIKRGVISDDYYAAGGTIDIDAAVAGDIVACGGEVSIAGTVEGDLMACGGQLRIKAAVTDDARVAGGEVVVDSQIGDDLIAAGGSVAVTTGSVIGGNAWLGGGEITMAGVVNQDLLIGGGTVRISGIVRGNVEIQSGMVLLIDGATVEGDLIYSSPEVAKIDSGVSIVGKTTHTRVDWERDAKSYGIFQVVTLLVAATVLFLLFPGFTVSTTERMSSDAWRSIGIGIVFLIVTPIVAVILMGIVLGVWVGLSMIALYLLSLLLAYLLAVFFIGGWLARLARMDVSSKGKRILSALVAIILLALVQLIPFIGGIAIFILLLWGFGAGLMQIYALYRTDKTTATAA